MTAFYNEIDPYAAQWLRNLIAAGHIAPGVVDERPIQEIEAYELVEFTQCHFFAGIGIWSHALRRAGWSDDRPIWTGSCPCQPFSNAGQKKGFQDDRHLWPYWKKLIDECRPSVVIGEQVASALDWVDLVSADMEGSGYAFGANDICAAGFGGAHIRQRIYFVGISDAVPTGRPERRSFAGNGQASSSSNLRLADPDSWERVRQSSGEECERDREASERVKGDSGVKPGCTISGLADGPISPNVGSLARSELGQLPQSDAGSGAEFRPADAPNLGGRLVDWLYCRDGKWRLVEPGTFPLVDETPARVGRLRAYGNGLDAETATEFCGTVREICDEAGI